MAIIGIVGKKQSGKDTIGMMIQHILSNSTKPIKEFMELSSGQRATYSHWKTVRFADKLKDIVCLLIGCTKEQLEDENFKEFMLGDEWDNIYDDVYYTKLLAESYSPRKLLQYIGTDLFRNMIHPNTWVNATMVNYKSKLVHDKATVATLLEPNWIIPDVRFPNEVEAIDSKQGLVIKVVRPSIIRENEHKSETALDDKEFHYTIINNGSIESLMYNVKDILIKEQLI